MVLGTRTLTVVSVAMLAAWIHLLHRKLACNMLASPSPAPTLSVRCLLRAGATSDAAATPTVSHTQLTPVETAGRSMQNTLNSYPLDKRADLSQTIFSDGLSPAKSFVF